MRFDKVKHRAVRVIGDASECFSEIEASLGDWRVDESHMARAPELYFTSNQIVDEAIKPTNANPMSYAQMLGVVNSVAADDDLVLTAAGVLPGEANKTGELNHREPYDCDYGALCIGRPIVRCGCPVLRRILFDDEF